MKNNPKVSIIIPVYNVEKYLRQCLDSVVNQTMWDIQIICVNDGSTDNSRNILQEYVDRDFRIEIIDKPNGGLASARNAAYPTIKGQYTLFVDSDDWIDLDCCEKVYQKAKQTEAEITFFFLERENGSEGKSPTISITPQDKTTIEEKAPLFEFGYAAGKLYQSDFLVNNRLLFPEGYYFEDFLVSWQGIVMAQRISVVLEKLYHYRLNPGSISSAINRTGFDTIPICAMTEKFLREYGYYDDYRDVFIYRKFIYWHWVFRSMTWSSRFKFLQAVRHSLTEDDQAFYRSTSGKKLLEKQERRFYRLIVDGGLLRTAQYYFFEIVKWPERLVRYSIVKPLKILLGKRRRTAANLNTAGNTISLPQESGEPSKRRAA